jgi:hypothetical protein
MIDLEKKLLEMELRHKLEKFVFEEQQPLPARMIDALVRHLQPFIEQRIRRRRPE